MALPRMLQLANYADPLYLFHAPICDALVRAGWRVELSCMEGGRFWDRLAGLGFPVHPLPMCSLRSVPDFCRLRRAIARLLRKERFDVIVVSTPVASWAARQASTRCTARIVYYAHGLAFAPIQEPLMYRLMRAVETYHGRYTDAVIVMNDADELACRRYRLTRTGENCFHIPGGVDFDHWSTPPSPQSLRELQTDLGLREGTPMVLYLGRFIRTKRPGDVLELARRLGSGVDVVMAGAGPLWPATRRQARQLGPHVKVLPFTDRIHELVHRSTVVVLPTVFPEGLPRILLEAQAAGVPAVAYDVRGPQDALVDGQTGRLVPPRDTHAFCEAVTALLSDEAARIRMGMAGRDRVAERYRYEIVAEQHVSAYKTILQANR